MRVPKFVLNITWIIPKKSKVIHELNLNHDLTIYYLCRVTQTTFVRIIISTNPQKIIFVEIILQLERKIISTNPQKIVFVRILSTRGQERYDKTAVVRFHFTLVGALEALNFQGRNTTSSTTLVFPLWHFRVFKTKRLVLGQLPNIANSVSWCVWKESVSDQRIDSWESESSQY